MLLVHALNYFIIFLLEKNGAMPNLLGFLHYADELHAWQQCLLNNLSVAQEKFSLYGIPNAIIALVLPKVW